MKKSVSMPQIMLDRAELRRRQAGLTTFSDYIQLLIRRDMEQQMQLNLTP